jgi:uncharacterized protein YyaL (SSP411 family)
MSFVKLRSFEFGHSRRVLGCWTVVLLSAILWANPLHASDVNWRKDADAALDESVRENKPLLVMVTAPWCSYCHKMLRQTFPDPRVAARINEQFVPIVLDADEYAELIQQLKIEAMPTILIVAPDRKIIHRSTGFKTAVQFEATLAAIAETLPKRLTRGERRAEPTAEANKPKSISPPGPMTPRR